MYRFFVLMYFQYVIVSTMVPSLSVRKTDKRLIARKRQDTFEMCRIFTKENSKIKQYNKPIKSNTIKAYEISRRVKRGVAGVNYGVNPTLNDKDVRRVESIVDKLYDDMEEKGEKINYRQQNITKIIAKAKNLKNDTARRFNFAPAELLGPLPTTATPDTSMPDTKIIDGINVRFPLGIVPYFVDSKTYDADLTDIIMKAFDYFEKATCIRLQRLRERPTDKESLKHVDWLYITNPSGIRQCVHSNERRKSEGVQMVVFGYDCMSLGDLAHEIMHILGFSHEHARTDRDQYISIMWDNIKPGYKKYFDINKNEYQNIVESLPYDYASVLHYPSRAFTKNGQFTILTQPGTKIGQREGLSEIDIEKIGLVYSNDCVKRNREYLLKTCPSVVRAETNLKNITQHEIENYFGERLWPFGIVHYKLRDKMEFSTEERENINAVIRHIEKETCIEFRDISTLKDDIDTAVPSVFGHKMDASFSKTDISTNSKQIHPQVFGVSNSDGISLSEYIPKENEIKTTDVKLKQSESEMKQSGSETKQSESEMKHSESEMKQSESENKQSESEIKQSGSEMKQSGSEMKQSESEMKRSESDIKQTESDMKQSESEMKHTEIDIKQSESEMKQSESEAKQSELEIKPPTGDLKQSDSDIEQLEHEVENSETEINHLETDITQSEIANKVSEVETEYSEKDIKKSKNQLGSTIDDNKPFGNKITPIKDDSDYDEINRKELESPITKLDPYELNKSSLSSERIKHLKTGKHIDSKQTIRQKETIVNGAKQNTKQAKRIRRSIRAPLTLRRHANNILVLTRSSEPGCKCPTPGRPNGNKILTINTDCFNSVNDLLHLFVHVLGLDHQHNMHDRDSYLHIVWDKLSPDIKTEMNTKLPPAASVGFPYDYQSVMHYPWLQIKNGVTNIMYPIWNDGWAMGHWQGLSSTDVQKLNLLYFNECVAKSQTMKRRFKQ